MKKLIFVVFIFMASTQLAWALVYVDTLDFPKPTFAQDLTSGNHLDFEYAHRLPTFSLTLNQIESVSLSLTHQGNQDEGPTKEIWHVLGDDVGFIGRLGKSTDSFLEDLWDIPDPLFDPLIEGENSHFKVFLSEQTPFNREKVELRQSRLTIRYQEIPQTPEPASWILLGVAFLMSCFCRLKK